MSACGITLDTARQRLDVSTLQQLLRFADERDLTGAFRAMVRGDPVNSSERRPALHTALRAPAGAALGGPPAVQQEVLAELARLRVFASEVRRGAWRGAGGAITDVINIGIGGSDLGPRLVCEALSEVADGPRVHFLSNVDGHSVAPLLASIDPATSLAIVSSKSFSTRETLLNAETVRSWLAAAGVRDERLARQLVVVSAKAGAAASLGVPADNQFHLWDWVGGRFSVWSAIGLPAMLALGPTRFDEFLGGGHAMDRHALDARLEDNLAATLALLAFWNITALRTTSECLLPYDERLRGMVPWLQQLEMESLGKSRTSNGAKVALPTIQPVWGGVGTDAQHTFFQALRQGTLRTAVDIILVERPHHGYPEQHRVLLANARAQAEALVAEDPDSQAVNAVNVLQLAELSPATLGALMALYEHKTTMLATLYGLNAFDQPGVELGKTLARQLEQR
ncbi:MAG TPA: glucose-6-phosphate isomerase [Burkholderiaceae bacterium]|nr:glucose-6-phosphate isomerase [Burkholderiaceae bacterium]